MKRVLTLSVLVLLLSLCGLVWPATARAQDDSDDDFPARTEGGRAECDCERGRACYHFLNAPFAPPKGRCSCDKCEQVDRHKGGKMPKGWNPFCFGSDKLECFLKRHSASWRFTCSECFANDKCCKTSKPHDCPNCQEDGRSPWKRGADETLKQQLEVERKVFTKREPIIIYSRRFYLVTDISKIKLMTQEGGPRIVSGHEYAHVMLARAELAYEEFSEAVGGRVGISRPMGIFLPEKTRTAEQLQEAYFLNKRYPMIYSAYASSTQSAIAGGFCLNGLSCALTKVGKDDLHLHEAVRHFIGHIMISCWIKKDGDNRRLPRWMFVGAGHWLGKRPPELIDLVYYCEGEDKKLGGSGKDWMKDLVKRAQSGKFDPIEQLLQKNSLGQLTYKDHQRVWGYFQLCMEEWRAPWVAMMADLRRETPARDAFLKNMKMSPEQFHERWEKRIKGELISMDPAKDKREAKTVEEPTAANLAAETDRLALAARLRSLGTVSDPGIVKAILGLIASWDDPLIRETALQSLVSVEDEAAQQAIIDSGLGHSNRIVRAHAARLCRWMELKSAKLKLRDLMNDGFWLARSEAALACGAIRDFDAQAQIRSMLGDPNAKARIAACDALRLFEEEVNPVCVPALLGNIQHADWQVRVATCQALFDVGDHRAVRPLIDRLKIEGGRMHEEILRTLRWITDDDLGEKWEHWDAWWSRTHAGVERDGGFKKPDKPRDPTMGGRYAAQVPQYYGVSLFSSKIGFVLDISRSTNRGFKADKSTLKRIPADQDGTTIIGICKAEIVRSIRALDPRADFNVVVFGSDVFKWKRQMQRANSNAKGSAESFVSSKQPLGETNMYGALLESLDLDGEDQFGQGFRDTPDTMTFLTDGAPTAGLITDPDTLRDWFRELNRYARVRTHVFAFGTLGVDEKLLRALATQNGGQFVQLFERAR